MNFQPTLGGQRFCLCFTKTPYLRGVQDTLRGDILQSCPGRSVILKTT